MPLYMTSEKWRVGEKPRMVFMHWSPKVFVENNDRSV